MSRDQDTSPVPERPATLLDGVAAAAFESFNAMQSTKRRHYDLLQILDGKRVNYGLAPTERESALLNDLLADHDAQVKRFTQASAALKQKDPNAHLALFRYIGVLEQSTDNSIGPGSDKTH